MTGASIRVEINDAAVQRAFRRLFNVVDDLTDVFTEIGDYVTESTDQRFIDQKSPDGEAWADLSSMTQARKTVNADKILTEHGGLHDTLHYNASSDSLEFGSNLPYAAMMQFGGTTSAASMLPNKTIPARPFLGINAADEAEIIAILADALDAATR